MERRIFFRPERCFLCQSCVLACQLRSLGVSDVRRLPREKRPGQRIRVEVSRNTPWATRCQHCLSAPCVEACVTGSLIREEGHREVIHRRETCVGCGCCLLVCPFGALSYEADEEKMTKCDLCSDLEEPACVGACQSGALLFRSSESMATEKKRVFARQFGRAHDGG